MTAPARFTKEAKVLSATLVRAAAAHPADEASFRYEAERALDKVAERHGLVLDNRRELTLATGRADTVFNRLIIEWEPPGALAAHESHRGNRHAIAQLQGYVNGLAARERREVERLAGVACDGRFMIFARYRAGRWIVDEPVPVDELSAEQLLESLFAAQAGRALTSDNLLREFGRATNLTRQLSRDLLIQLNTSIGHDPDGLVARHFRQWEMFFAVATGVSGDAERPRSRSGSPSAA